LRALFLLGLVLVVVAAGPAAAVAEEAGGGPVLRVTVDVSDAPRRLLHAHLSIPVRGTSITLLYPKWIPGEHGPTGPISDLAGLRFSAGGKDLAWKRDPLDMYALDVEVPPGNGAIEARFSYIVPPTTTGFTSAASASPRLAVVSWNQVVLYPRGTRPEEVPCLPALRLPEGWGHGTALETESAVAGDIRFAPVSLTKLIDSPVLTGLHMRTIDLTPSGGEVPHRVHIAADSAEALNIGKEHEAALRRLVKEGLALFGARHYSRYDFLYTLSDHVAHFGLEHHESSDNRVPERTLIDTDLRMDSAGLLPHEFVHSWNGKYRRPADLLGADLQEPFETGLLWVYEGLTSYLGAVLTARSGLLTAGQVGEELAIMAARLDNRPGRAWRPLADTAVAAQVLFRSRGDWGSLRRGVDFYPEGVLIWLEADVLIRTKTGGERSLDDFCRLFHGGRSGPAEVVPYTFDDIVAALGEIAPHDWRGFFRERVEQAAPRAPLGGIEAGGWRLVHSVEPTEMEAIAERAAKRVDYGTSIGIIVTEDGTLEDVIPGSPADRAGLAPATTILGVNGRRFTPEGLLQAVRATRDPGSPVILLAENGDFIREHRVDYTGGVKYPRLERDPSRPDLLGVILAPKSK
jgi:predicted metalloprotease with PDZ domain